MSSEKVPLLSVPSQENRILSPNFVETFRFFGDSPIIGFFSTNFGDVSCISNIGQFCIFVF